MSSSASSSDRVCQFFLRGRCQRENCEFRHDVERLKAIQSGAAAAASSTATVAPAVAAVTAASGASSAASSTSSSSLPLCRFFQAGTCKFRNNCRFRHERQPSSGSSGFTAPAPRPPPKKITTAAAAPLSSSAAPPSAAKNGGGGEDSDDESIFHRAGSDDDENESIASGFTDVHATVPVKTTTTAAAAVPAAPETKKAPKEGGGEKEKKADKEKSAPMSPPMTTAKASSDKTVEKASTKDVEMEPTSEKALPTAVEKKSKTAAPESKTAEAASEPKPTVPKKTTTAPEPAAAKETAEVETPAAVAAPDTTADLTVAADETIPKPLEAKALTRKATVSAANKTGQDKKKEIKRDSKGFQNFDDYFSESDPDTSQTTPQSSAKKGKTAAAAADDSVESVPEEATLEETPKPVRTPSRPTRQAALKQTKAPETPVDSPKRGKKEAVKETTEAAKEKKASKESSSAEKDVSSNQDSETIENIMNFIHDESSKGEKSKGKKDLPKKPSKAEAAKSPAAAAKETSVAEIFGGDGKKDAERSRRKKEERASVYDLEVDGVDFSGADATPFVSRQDGTAAAAAKGSGKRALAKKEGVTKIGNNTYFYTGPKGRAAAAAAAAAEEENEEEEDDDEDLIVGGDDDDEDDEDYEDDDAVLISNVGATSMEDDESSHDDSSSRTPSKRGGRTYSQGRRKHRTNYVYGAKSTAAKTRRCGECEGCNREDCGRCEPCKDKPKFGGRGQKKQACVHRVCSWKNPNGKNVGRGRGRGSAAGTPAGTPRTPGLVTPRTATTPTTSRGSAAKDNKRKLDSVASRAIDKTEEDGAGGSGKKRGRKSISVISPASIPKRRKSSEERPDDSQLPDFDPNKFKPGIAPPIVKKGDAEYMVIVSGVKDTGLCGKYWSDMEVLPQTRRRRSNKEDGKSPQPSPVPSSNGSSGSGGAKGKVVEASPTPKRGRGRGKRKNEEEEVAAEEEEAEEPFAKEDMPAPKKAKTPTAAAAAPKPPVAGSESIRPKMAEEMSVNVVHSDFDKSKENESKENAARRFSSNVTSAAAEEIAAAVAEQQTPKRSARGPPPALTPVSSGEIGDSNADTDAQTPSNAGGGGGGSANRSVSCVADTSTQREVVVECFAPYDDHRWVNIGKERDGMNPDAVQYARALRPPYHLLSFLRIKGYSTKGMSCTDKNTMVFVVLEGEITVVLHTTQFVAKKGDSFYIPPKNYYNLINQKVREAELSLIQFQYDGPLPTVSAGSQSGNPNNGSRSQQPVA